MAPNKHRILRGGRTFRAHSMGSQRSKSFKLTCFCIERYYLQPYPRCVLLLQPSTDAPVVLSWLVDNATRRNWTLELSYLLFSNTLEYYWPPNWPMLSFTSPNTRGPLRSKWILAPKYTSTILQSIYPATIYSSLFDTSSTRIPGHEYGLSKTLLLHNCETPYGELSGSDPKDHM